MVPECRTEGEEFSIPKFDLEPRDVEGYMDELWEFQSAFHACFAHSEPRQHFFDYLVGNAVCWNAGRSNQWPSTSRAAPSAGCSSFSVMCVGIKSRCCGTLISSLLPRWATPMAYCWSTRPAWSKRARIPSASRGNTVEWTGLLVSDGSWALAESLRDNAYRARELALVSNKRTKSTA